MVHEGQLHAALAVLDGRDLVEDRSEPLEEEPLERVALDGDEVELFDREGFTDVREAEALGHGRAGQGGPPSGVVAGVRGGRAGVPSTSRSHGAAMSTRRSGWVTRSGPGVTTQHAPGRETSRYNASTLPVRAGPWERAEASGRRRGVASGHQQGRGRHTAARQDSRDETRAQPWGRAHRAASENGGVDPTDRRRRGEGPPGVPRLGLT